ncbi:MAG TPA: flagellin, partial [Candidatus Obscuribacterales bacterium]
AGGGNISASYDATTDKFTITNTPGFVGTKLTDPGLPVGASTISIDFGSNGAQSIAFNQNTDTINSIVTKLDALTGVDASFDASTDKLTITNNAVNLGTQLTDTGLGTGGTVSIDFGSNGTKTFAFDPIADTLATVVSKIDQLDGTAGGGNISASYDATADQITISNNAAVVGTKLTDPGLPAGASTISIDFGSNGAQSIAFNQNSDTINSIVTKLDALTGVDASFDTTTDKLTITNNAVLIGKQLTDPGLVAGTISIDFGANGVKTFAFNPSTDTLATVVSKIDTLDGTAGGGNISASYDATTDKFTITNTAVASQINSPAPIVFVPGNFTIDFGANNPGGLGNPVTIAFDPSTDTISTLVARIDAIDGTAGSGNINASYDSTTDTVTISNKDTGSPKYNRIIFGGANGAALYEFFNLSDAPDTTSATNTSQSSADIDNGGALDITAGDVTGKTFNQLIGNNGIKFSTGGAATVALASALKLSDVASTGTGTTSAVSSAAIDNGVAPSVLDITASDVTGKTFSALTANVYGSNAITFGTDAASASFASLFKLGDKTNTGTSSQGTVSTADIDNETTNTALDLVAGDLTKTINSLTTTQIRSGSNAIQFDTTAGGISDALRRILKLTNTTDSGSNGLQSISSSGEIDNGVAPSVLDLSAGDYTTKTFNTLTGTNFYGSNAITFGTDAASASFASLFKLGDKINTSTSSQGTVSTTDIDNSGSNALLDLAAGDLGSTIKSLTTTQIQGGNNAIQFDSTAGSASDALRRFFKLTNVADNGSNAAQIISSSADIDNSSSNAALNITAADVTGTSFSSLVNTQIRSGSNAIQFDTTAGGVSDALRRIFKLTNVADSGSNGAQSITSSADIDNSGSNPALDITVPDVTGATFQALTAATSGGSNQISFGGVNGANIASFFKLSSVADNGTGNPRSISSSADISSQALHASLDVSPTDVNGTSIRSLFTPKLSTLVSGNLKINGDTALNINSAVHTINDVVNAVNALTGSGNQDYTASFATAVAGGLRIAVTDTATLTPPGSAAVANPGGASPTVNGNTLTLDSAAFIANNAPLSINGGTALGSGSGPAEQPAFAASSLNPAFNPTAPSPAGTNVSGISFGGATNLASVLFLNTAASGTATASGSDQFRGIVTPTGQHSFDLAADFKRTFQASSSTTSTQQLGTAGTGGVQSGELGVVARIFVQPGVVASYNDHSLTFQVGPDEGHTLSEGIDALTPESLGLESLNLIGSTPDQSYLRGVEVLSIVDAALDAANSTRSTLGIMGEILDHVGNSLANEQVNLSKQLSDLQDADLEEEISNLTRAQVNQQAGSLLLSQSLAHERTLYNLLFGGF